MLHNDGAFDRAVLDAINDTLLGLLGGEGAIIVQELMEFKSGEEMWVLAKNPETLARVMGEIFGRHESLAIERMIIKRLAEKLRLESSLAGTSSKNFAEALQFLRASLEKAARGSPV
jgi:hypothetical protein